MTLLNKQLAAAGKAPVQIVAADERLEDEDILELVSAGVVPATLVDNRPEHRSRRQIPAFHHRPVLQRRTDGKTRQGAIRRCLLQRGAARIARLRKKAAEQGLDPNVWFGNVEVVAARDIGRETVDYVSNIYKYYVSYRLITESALERKEAKSTVAQ